MNTTCHPKKPVTWTLGASVAVAAPAVLFLGAAIGHADLTTYQIKSPSGNIACNLYVINGVGTAHCNVADHTWPAPPLPADCRFPPVTGSSPEFYLDQGKAPGVDQCGPGEKGIFLESNLQTLNYGQTQSAGAITCDSEPSGMTCTDTSTGHFFRLSRDSYQLG